MDLQVRAHMEMLHLSLMMGAGVGQRFESMPEERQRQADAALFIRHDIKKAPDYLWIMTKTNEFGFWAFHAKEMTFGGKKGPVFSKLYKHTAKAVLAGMEYGTQRDYQSSFLSAFRAVEDYDGASVRDFMVEFLFQARRSKKAKYLKPLLWKLPGDSGDYARAQEELLKVFNEQEGFVDFMLANASRKLINVLTVNYSLGSLVRYLTRKGRGKLLCDQLGL